MWVIQLFTFEFIYKLFIESTFPSKTSFDSPLRAIGRDDELSKWQRKQYHTQNQIETPAPYKLSNGRDRQGPRALIDAYGSDTRNTPSSDRPLRVERLDTNGLDHRPSSMSWQNTEEEEFDWEDIGPTLADRGRSDDILQSSVPSLGRFKPRPDIRNSWSGQAQLPAADDSSTVSDDSVPSLGVCFLHLFPFLLFNDYLMKIQYGILIFIYQFGFCFALHHCFLISMNALIPSPSRFSTSLFCLCLLLGSVGQLSRHACSSSCHCRFYS